MITVFNKIITSITHIIFGKLFVTKKSTFISLGVLTIVALVIYQLFFRLSDTEPVVDVKNIPVVTLSTVGNIGARSLFNAVGVVEAISEARLKVEAGGAVTGVYTEIGKPVKAGAILAQVDSARESASLLQAQGAYEAALAGSAQSGSVLRDAQNSLQSAQNDAVTTYKSTYTSVSGSLFGTIDQFFSNPEGSIPGVRLSSSYTGFLNAERVSLQPVLPRWQTKTITLFSTDNLDTALTEAEETAKKVLAITDAFIDILNKESRNTQYTDEELRAFGTTFNGVRATLVANLGAINNARSLLTSAAEGVKRAEIAGSGSGITQSGAQLKIALGSLRSAQAAYEKTLVRSPIAGVINALYIKKGDYANSGQDAAIVANNNGLQIKTAINQEDTTLIKIGDSVVLDTNSTGVVSAIAGAIDPTTGKVAVIISVDDNSTLTNGSSVSISFTHVKTTTLDNAPIVIPLSSVKLTASGPVAFSVDEINKLVALPLELGAVVGENVTITKGLTIDSKIVLDARGLKAGEEVTISTK